MRSTKLPSWTEKLLGFEPLPAPPHVFAVGPGKLTYARFPSGPAGFSLAEHREVDLPDDAFAGGLLGGVPRDPSDLAGRVGALLDEVEPRPERASLVLPDAWLRVTFLDVEEELPPPGEGRTDVLRWKLKRTVPFRVEELRIEAVEVAPLPAQEEGTRRMMLGFALEGLIAGLERAFSAHGVRIGQVSSGSLSMLPALGSYTADKELAAVALAEPEAYTLTFLRRGEPVLHRYKPQRSAMADAAAERFVTRDLKLTMTFLEEHFDASSVDACLLAAPPELEERWSLLLDAGVGVVPSLLRPGHLPLADGAPAGAGSWQALAPLLGAAAREVA